MPRALYTAAREDVPCPKCHAPKGVFCRTPKGRKANQIHSERVGALVQARPEALDEAEVKGVFTFEDLRTALGI